MSPELHFALIVGGFVILVVLWILCEVFFR